MRLEFDPAKSARNAAERGLPFETVEEFQWGTAVYEADTRFPYAEPRFVALGLIGERIHSVCFTPIPDGVRVISFRKANKREIASYVRRRQQTTVNDT